MSIGYRDMYTATEYCKFMSDQPCCAGILAAVQNGTLVVTAPTTSSSGILGWIQSHLYPTIGIAAGIGVVLIAVIVGLVIWRRRVRRNRQITIQVSEFANNLDRNQFTENTITIGRIW